ncbi:MAG: SpoIIE family protein phosphatase, partial [Alphaproteobacteria bacterium]|nr:SpoIIE family protein phosphatase [Alphaproteobacteria bacterium]
KAALAALAAGGTRGRFCPGERIMVEGDASNEAFAILSGTISILNESAHGTVTLAQRSGPALVGEIGVLAGLPRTATVRADTEVVAWRIEREPFISACLSQPEILVSVVKQLGTGIFGINQALGLYTHCLTALERVDFDPGLLDDLNNPSQQLKEFSKAFSRMATQIALQRNRAQEMVAAATIQQALLPDMIDQTVLGNRATVFASMTPARAVGGDFYDMFAQGNNRLAIAVGDVCGKGVPAALFMSVALTVLRMVGREDRPIDEAIEKINDQLCADNASSMFATLFFASIDLTSGELDYVCCGHNPAFLISANGMVRPLAAAGIPLGVLPGHGFEAAKVRLAPGDALFLFTDGVTEANNEMGEEFGDQRLAELLEGLGGAGPRQMIETVVAAVSDFAGDAEQFDDITCLCFKPGDTA